MKCVDIGQNGVTNRLKATSLVRGVNSSMSLGQEWTHTSVVRTEAQGASKLTGIGATADGKGLPPLPADLLPTTAQ